MRAKHRWTSSLWIIGLHQQSARLQSRIGLTAESVRLANPAVDEAVVLTDAQAPKDLLLWNPGHSLRADSIVFEARQEWIREVIIHAMCIIRTAGPTRREAVVPLEVG